MSSSRDQSKSPAGARASHARSARLRAQASGPLFSSKARPSRTRRLSDLPLDEDEVLIDAFDATLDGIKVRVTAVLERTCVYLDRDGDRRLASKNDLWVEASQLPIRQRGIS